MIDVVFLLVVFFVAVSQIVDQDRVTMDLPAPSPSAAPAGRASSEMMFGIHVPGNTCSRRTFSGATFGADIRDQVFV